MDQTKEEAREEAFALIKEAVTITEEAVEKGLTAADEYGEKMLELTDKYSPESYMRAADILENLSGALKMTGFVVVLKTKTKTKN